MRSGDRPGLQNRRAAGDPVTGGFDPHSLPPFVCNELPLTWRSLWRRMILLAVLRGLNRQYIHAHSQNYSHPHCSPPQELSVIVQG